MFFRLTKVLFNTFLLVLLLLSVGILLTLGRAPGGWKSYVVLSGSMMPAIAPGTLIVTKPFDEYVVGDIVTRKTIDPRITITHRIVEKMTTELGILFQMKGDANQTIDSERIPPGDIIGKTVFIFPYVGTVVNYAKTKQGFFLMVLIPSSLIILEESLNIIVAIRKRQKRSLKVL